MELLRKRGSAPRFPFELFQKQQNVYDNSPKKQQWESLEDLQNTAGRETSATILGHIGKDTAEKWLAWERGELYAVGYRGVVLFCVPGGTVVV